MGERYRLRFIRDLCDVPIEKLDECLTDLRRLVLATHAMRETLGDLATVVHLNEELEWHDDGDRSATVNVTARDASLFSVRVGPRVSPDGTGGAP